MGGVQRGEGPAGGAGRRAFDWWLPERSGGGIKPGSLCTARDATTTQREPCISPGVARGVLLRETGSLWTVRATNCSRFRRAACAGVERSDAPESARRVTATNCQPEVVRASQGSTLTELFQGLVRST